MSGHLSWSIKASLLSYVRQLPDGEIVLADGASADDDGLRWPGTGATLAFAGSVTLRGHGGLMRVTIASPAIVPGASGWELTIADPDDAGLRLRFATIASFDGTRAHGTALTENGADLFFGPYESGTQIDDPVARA